MHAAKKSTSPFTASTTAPQCALASHHLKTDSRHLHEYTKAVVEKNGLPVEACCADIYGTGFADELLSIKTTYEKRFLAEGLPITYLKFSPGGRTVFEAPEFAPDEAL